VQRILRQLLRERVPVRDLTTILEALADAAVVTKDPDALTAHVREPYAARYDFTSALALQMLRSIGPELRPLLNDPAGSGTGSRRVRTDAQATESIHRVADTSKAD